MKEYQKFAEQLARKAGIIMKEYFTVGVDYQTKSDNTPLTIADQKINDLVIDEISKEFPDHSINGEEGDHMVEKSEYLWVCDPIDGTKPFTLGIPVAVFSLALLKDGEVIVGVVYDPFCDRMYSASKGNGAYLNNVKMNVSKKTEFAGMIAEQEIYRPGKYNIEPLVTELYGKDIRFLGLCAFIYPSALVAAGQIDFTLFPHITAHDVAAIKILVEEAGGKVTDMYGNEQRYDQPINGALVSNGLIHDELVALSKQFVKFNDGWKE